MVSVVTTGVAVLVPWLSSANATAGNIPATRQAHNTRLKIFRFTSFTPFLLVWVRRERAIGDEAICFAIQRLEPPDQEACSQLLPFAAFSALVARTPADNSSRII